MWFRPGVAVALTGGVDPAQMLGMAGGQKAVFQLQHQLLGHIVAAHALRADGRAVKYQLGGVLGSNNLNAHNTLLAIAKSNYMMYSWPSPTMTSSPLWLKHSVLMTARCFSSSLSTTVATAVMVSPTYTGLRNFRVWPE